ncbi:MAG: type II secretion system protein [Myxococcales bacterium]|nr:type II secretion system protein [Myxococcales bacterium]MCB9649815.1 type II secretion system protein [Deltaproteobacteria bacterium]
MGKRLRHRSRRGFTLIELTIALAIAAMMVGVTMISVQSLTHADLKNTSLELAGAVKYNYDRAIMEKRIQRIAMDLDRQLWWIEYTEDPYGLDKERLRGDTGAKLDADGKVVKEDDDSFWDDDADEEVKRALEGGKAASFVPEGEPHTLPGDVRFAKIQTGHQEEPFTSGVAYLHFFRGGWTEPAQIEITDGDEVISLKVFPLTGRVRTYDEPLKALELEDQEGREEGDL